MAEQGGMNKNHRQHAKPMGKDLSPADFQKLVMKSLCKEGCVVQERGALELTIGSKGTKFYLGNLYQQYREGARLDDIVQRLSQILQEMNQAVASEKLPLDLTRLFPMLKSRGWLDEVMRGFTDVPAWRPFITSDVVVTLVEDMPSSLRYVKPSEVTAVGRTIDDLLDVALGNLLERTEAQVYQVGDQDCYIFVLDTKDGYDATRILVSPLMEQLAEKVNGDMVIGIPNRDCLIAFGNENPSTVEVALNMEQDALTHTYPLTSMLFTLQAGELKVYKAWSAPQCH
jgi:uncharacterized protein YtpQ (UPF0354 family)